MALALLCIVVAAVNLASEVTMQSARYTRRSADTEAAVATADGYLDWAYDYWITTCRLHGNVAWTDFSLLTQPPATALVQPKGYTVGSFAITAVDPQMKALQGNPPVAVSGQMPSLGDQAYFYIASVDLLIPTSSAAHPTIKVEGRRIFQKTLSSPWQYAIFYNDELEIHPSPVFSVTGKVHTNDKLYASPDGGNSLTFQSPFLEYSVPPPAPNVVDGYDPVDALRRGKAQAGAANTYSSPPVQASRQDPFGISPSSFDLTNPNTSDQYRELIERPDTTATDTFSSGLDQNGNPINPRYYNAADIKVLIDANNVITVIQGTGPTGTTLQSTDPTYKAVAAALTTNQSIQDFREAAQVRLVTLDVSQLNTQLANSQVAGWNGVIYITDTSAGQTGGAPKRGVRVKNGATIPKGGITVVSDNPVYVQGDFNTTFTGTRPPSALVGDAINVLSNAWQDVNSSASLSSRVATSTTVNAAFLSGIVPTTGTTASNASYSGGVENFPRFHEDWSGGKTFTYNGSMVELFYSKQAIGQWGKASYNPPVRNWAFDTVFLTTPPPGSLMTTKYSKQTWSSHSYAQSPSKP